MPPTPPAPANKPQGPRRVTEAVAIEQIKTKLRRRKSKKANIRVAALNITSFLDMSFCLLMFLTLSAGGAGVKEGVFTSNLTKIGGEGGAADPNEVPKITRPINLVVSIRGENQYVIEIDATQSTASNFEALTKTLRELNTAVNQAGVYPDDSPVIIRPRGDVPWYGVVSAFNSAVRARFKNVGFARVGG